MPKPPTLPIALALTLLPAQALLAQGLVVLLNPGGDRQLAVVHPENGATTLLGTPLAGVAIGSVSGSDALDRSGNRFFFAGTPSGGNPALYSVSTIDGHELASPDVTNAQNGIMMLEWDGGESLLFALVSVGAGDRQLATVNPATGAVALRGNPIAGTGLGTSGASTLDPAGNRFYFAGAPNGGNLAIYAINTANGLEVSSPDFGGSLVAVNELAWDTDDSILFALVTVAGGDRQVATVNTSTGAVSLRGNPIAGASLSATGAAMDDVADRLYFVGTPGAGSRAVYTINSVNGIEVQSPDFSGTASDVVAVAFDAGPLFADTFDAGTTGAWSTHSP